MNEPTKLPEPRPYTLKGADWSKTTSVQAMAMVKAMSAFNTKEPPKLMIMKSRSRGWSTIIAQAERINNRAKFIQHVQSIVSAWWKPLQIEQYEHERIERMNRWSRR